ncbi:hypothetical protein MUN74_18285 [Agromyces endophyticus]|uniref:hypothetical protein n=1 Tax=Agromyces sp. H17E-10 TaxID=2932244 RepID=UPI001FD04416|nr:hypothetical protein [Agromyces sp. H17E-10]UOQ89182.1 hypothetical protein MUN74_18285 [Agromyces sp. H17E-10]
MPDVVDTDDAVEPVEEELWLDHIDCELHSQVSAACLEGRFGEEVAALGEHLQETLNTSEILRGQCNVHPRQPSRGTQVCRRALRRRIEGQTWCPPEVGPLSD